MEATQSFSIISSPKAVVMQSNEMGFNPEILRELITYKMPFGKYQGHLLTKLPVSYLEWFNRKGFPEGKLGMLLHTLYEIKLNGLDFLLDGLRKNS